MLTSSAHTSVLPPISLSIAPTFTHSLPLSSSASSPLSPSSSSGPKAPRTKSLAPPSSLLRSPPLFFTSSWTFARPPASNSSGLFRFGVSRWTGFPPSISGSSGFSSQASFFPCSPLSSGRALPQSRRRADPAWFPRYPPRLPLFPRLRLRFARASPHRHRSFQQNPLRRARLGSLYARFLVALDLPAFARRVFPLGSGSVSIFLIVTIGVKIQTDPLSP